MDVRNSTPGTHSKGKLNGGVLVVYNLSTPSQTQAKEGCFFSRKRFFISPFYGILFFSLGRRTDTFKGSYSSIPCGEGKPQEVSSS